MSCTWMIVANSAVARIFQMEKNGEMKEIETLVHPASRLHGRDLTSDRPGRVHESATAGRHAIEPPTNPKELEFTEFAKEIAKHLNAALLQGKFNRLCLAASPHFLGLLRQALTPNTSQATYATLDKDMTHMSPNEIRQHLLAAK